MGRNETQQDATGKQAPNSWTFGTYRDATGQVVAIEASARWRHRSVWATLRVNLRPPTWTGDRTHEVAAAQASRARAATSSVASTAAAHTHLPRDRMTSLLHRGTVIGLTIGDPATIRRGRPRARHNMS